MFGDRDYLRTVEVGRRNQEVKVLIQNWCRHARIEKCGGTGMIEAATGFPIGHHSMACDHAPAGGSATWRLEDAAIEFYDRHCVGCKVRHPLRLPNLIQLVHSRDKQESDNAAHFERHAKTLRDEFDSRQAVRTALQVSATVPVATLIEDLQLLDQSRTQQASEKVIATALLAPEVFNSSVVEHLFHLIEASESWAIETSLRCLRIVGDNHTRLVDCAMQSLSMGCSINTAAEILLAYLDLVDESRVQPAVKSLCLLAAPPRSDFGYFESDSRPEALRALVSKFPASVEKAFDALIGSSSGEEVALAARAIPLIYANGAYPSGVVRSLAAKLARVDSVVDGDRDSEIDKVAHELKRALVHAMLADSNQVDTLLESYYRGASNAGEARIAKVYASLLSLPGNRFESVDTVPDLRPYATALRRILQWTSATKNQEVIQALQEAFRRFPAQLAQVAYEQMESLLGSAALVDQALTNFASPPRIQTESNSFLAHLDRENQRQRLAGLRDSLLEWASSAAAVHPGAAAKFIGFVASDVQWPEQFRSALIKALPPLMNTAASTNSVLPFLYGAMVGESALVRIAAARALQELHYSRINDLPSLVHDAFLLFLSDPIIGVHQSAVEALRRISLPKEYEECIRWRLIAIFSVYLREGREHDEFLVTCVDLLVSRMDDETSFSGEWAPVFVAVLMKVDNLTLLRHGRSWMLKRLINVEGFPDLLLKLLRSAERNEHHDEELVSLLHELPKHGVINMRPSLVALCAQVPGDRILVGACIEVLSSAEAWDASAEIAGCAHDAISDSKRMQMRKQYAQLTVLSTEFERHLANGRHKDALACAAKWRCIAEKVKSGRGGE